MQIHQTACGLSEARRNRKHESGRIWRAMFGRCMAPAVVAVRGAAKRWLGSGTRLFLPGDVFGDAGRFSFLCTAWTLAADRSLIRQQIAPAFLDTGHLHSPPPQYYSVTVKHIHLYDVR